MDEIIKQLGGVLSGLGLAGVVIAAQGGVIWWLLNQWQKAQEFRVTEAKEATKAMTATEAALTRLTDLLRAGRGNGP